MLTSLFVSVALALANDDLLEPPAIVRPKAVTAAPVMPEPEPENADTDEPDEAEETGVITGSVPQEVISHQEVQDSIPSASGSGVIKQAVDMALRGEKPADPLMGKAKIKPVQNCGPRSLRIWLEENGNYHLHFMVDATPHGGIQQADRRRFSVEVMCDNGKYKLHSVTRKDCSGRICMDGENTANSVTFECPSPSSDRCYARKKDGSGLNSNLFTSARIVGQFK